MQVVVDAAKLKRMFRELKPILHRSDDGGLLGIFVDNNVLTITCKNGIIYERQFATDAQGSVAVTVIYRDLSELLPSSGLALLTLSDRAVMISTSEFSTTLQAAYGEVTPYKRRCSSFKNISSAKLVTLAQMFTVLSPVSRTLKTESSVLLTSEVAICKYPSVWLEIPFTDFSTSIGVRELRVIASFSPRSVGVADDAIEFLNDSALLAIPITPVGIVTTCNSIMRNPKPAIRFHSEDVSAQVASFSRSVSGSCKLTFCVGGTILSYKSQTVEMCYNLGDTSEPIYTLDTYTEYLQMIFRFIIGKDVELTVADNVVMLSVQNEFKLIFAII